MSKMNGKYIIKESTAVAVQYFLIHQALGLGSGAVLFSLIGKCFLSKSSSSFMNWQVSFLQIVQSSGVPLIIAVGATTIPAKIQEVINYFKVLPLQVDYNQLYQIMKWKIIPTYPASQAHRQENLPNYPTMVERPFQRHCVLEFFQQERFRWKPFLMTSSPIIC